MLKYWIDEVVRLVEEENYSIKEACIKVKSRKEHYENENRSKSKS